MLSSQWGGLVLESGCFPKWSADALHHMEWRGCFPLLLLRLRTEKPEDAAALLTSGGTPLVRVFCCTLLHYKDTICKWKEEGEFETGA